MQHYGPRRGHVELDGPRYRIRAEVHMLGGYAAHTDQRFEGDESLSRGPVSSAHDDAELSLLPGAWFRCDHDLDVTIQGMQEA